MRASSRPVLCWFVFVCGTAGALSGPFGCFGVPLFVDGSPNEERQFPLGEPLLAPGIFAIQLTLTRWRRAFLYSTLFTLNLFFVYGHAVAFRYGTDGFRWTAQWDPALHESFRMKGDDDVIHLYAALEHWVGAIALGLLSLICVMTTTLRCPEAELEARSWRLTRSWFVVYYLALIFIPFATMQPIAYLYTLKPTDYRSEYPPVLWFVCAALLTPRNRRTLRGALGFLEGSCDELEHHPAGMGDGDPSSSTPPRPFLDGHGAASSSARITTHTAASDPLRHRLMCNSWSMIWWVSEIV